jgi:hypothetical protein
MKTEGSLPYLQQTSLVVFRSEFSESNVSIHFIIFVYIGSVGGHL